jgi:hypothetical protein
MDAINIGTQGISETDLSKKEPADLAALKIIITAKLTEVANFVHFPLVNLVVDMSKSGNGDETLYHAKWMAETNGKPAGAQFTFRTEEDLNNMTQPVALVMILSQHPFGELFQVAMFTVKTFSLNGQRERNSLPEIFLRDVIYGMQQGHIPYNKALETLNKSLHIDLNIAEMYKVPLQPEKKILLP